jgi:hypothetical protein
MKSSCRSLVADRRSRLACSAIAWHNRRPRSSQTKPRHSGISHSRRRGASPASGPKPTWRVARRAYKREFAFLEAEKQSLQQRLNRMQQESWTKSAKPS